MSIVADVKRDVAGLKLDAVTLRKFGLLVGAVFVGLGFWFHWHKHAELAGVVLAGIGAILFFLGLAVPTLLKRVYQVWMGLAMTLGWFVSRILLILLFYGIVVPIGLVARVTGKRFLDLPARGERETMWMPRPVKARSYEKMY